MSWQQPLNKQRSTHGPVIKEALDNAFGFEDEPQRFRIWHQLMLLLMRGHQPTLADLATRLQLSPSTVAAAVDTFPSTEWDREDDASADKIVGSLVTSVPTRHSIALIQSDGQVMGPSADSPEGGTAGDGLSAEEVNRDESQSQLYAWCAFDAPLLAELMVAPIRLRTLAAGSDNPLVIDFYPGDRIVSLGTFELSLPRQCAPETPLRHAFCQRSQVRVGADDGSRADNADGADRADCADGAHTADIQTVDTQSCDTQAADTHIVHGAHTADTHIADGTGPDDVVWVSPTEAAGIAQDIATQYRALLR